jgi:hypothetical protein
MKASVHIINKAPLSEAAILSLHNLLLTNGIHYIQMPDVQTGRFFLYTFLRLFLPYKNSGCLTFNTMPLEPYVTALHSCFEENDDDVGVKKELFGEKDFFYNICHFDFIWIEKDTQFAHGRIIAIVENMFIEHQLETRIPVLIIDYVC